MRRVRTVKEMLNKIREPKKVSKKRATIYTLSIFIFGIALGIMSKWLDNIAFDDTIGWHRPIEVLDLGNFFSDIGIWLLLALMIAVFSASPVRAGINTFAFFAGTCVAYHAYTVLFSGFDPQSYMMIWYGITLFSPVLAVLCWYAKGKGIVPIVLGMGIMAIITLSCFSIGLFYVDIKGILYILIYVASAVVLHRDPKQLVAILIGGFLLAFLLNPLWPYH